MEAFWCYICKLFRLAKELLKSTNPFFFSKDLYHWFHTLFMNENIIQNGEIFSLKSLLKWLAIHLFSLQGGWFQMKNIYYKSDTLVLRALDVVFKCIVGSTAQQLLPLRTSKILAHQNAFIQLSSSIQLQFRTLLHRRRISLKSQRIQEQREGFYLFVCSSPLWDSPRTKKENSSQSGKNRTAKVCAAWHTIKYYWLGKLGILYSQPAPSSRSHNWLQRLRFPSPLETFLPWRTLVGWCKTDLALYGISGYFSNFFLYGLVDF